MKKVKSNLYNRNSYNETHLFNNSNSFKNLLTTELNISKKIGLMELDLSNFYRKTIGEGRSFTNPKNHDTSHAKNNLKKSLLKKMYNSYSNIFANNNGKEKIGSKKIYIGDLYYFDYKLENSNVPVKEKKKIEIRKYWLLNSQNFTPYPPSKKEYNNKNSRCSTTVTLNRNKTIENKNDSEFKAKKNNLNKIYLALPNENEIVNLNSKKDTKMQTIKNYSSKNSPIKPKRNINIYLNNQNKFTNNDKNKGNFFKTQIDRNNLSKSKSNQNFKTLEKVKSERNIKKFNISKKMITELLNRINDTNSDLKMEIRHNKPFLRKRHHFSRKLKLYYTIKPMIQLDKEEQMRFDKIKEIKVNKENRKIGIVSFENPKEVLDLHKKLDDESNNIKNLFKNNKSILKAYNSIQKIKSGIV